MIDIELIEDEKLSQTFRLLKHQFVSRGWKAKLAYLGSPHCFIDRGDGKTLHIFSATPPTASYAAASLANDKAAAYELLKEAELPQPESITANSYSEFSELTDFMQKHGKVVVKPVDGGHGKGITVNVTTAEELSVALEEANRNRKSIEGAIIQEQYDHPTIYDIRMLCIDYKFVGAIWRVQARVYGDGQNTIQQLIENENNSERRGRPYFAPLATISITKAQEYLGDRMQEIPAVGEEVSVLGMANYGAGGETVDITDDMPVWIREAAEKAAQVCELPVAGVDFMIADHPTAQSTVEQLDAVIIEINKCPSLAIHDEPTSGTPRNASGHYADYLAKI